MSYKSTKTTEKLNKLIADNQIFYAGLRNLHWTVKGNTFFQLHDKFEELYNEVNGQIDELAERVLQLGDCPLLTLSEYVQESSLTEWEDTFKEKESIEHVIKTFEYLIGFEKEILETAEAEKDIRTEELMADYIVKQEKHIWMLKAFLG